MPRIAMPPLPAGRSLPKVGAHFLPGPRVPERTHRMPMWSLMRRVAPNWAFDAPAESPTEKMMGPQTDLVYVCERDGCDLWMSPEDLTPEREREIEAQVRAGSLKPKMARHGVSNEF